MHFSKIIKFFYFVFIYTIKLNVIIGKWNIFLFLIHSYKFMNNDLQVSVREETSEWHMSHMSHSLMILYIKS